MARLAIFDNTVGGDAMAAGRNSAARSVIAERLSAAHESTSRNF